MTTASLALIISTVIFIQLLIWLLVVLYRQKKNFPLQADTRKTTAVVIKTADVSELAWQGYRSFTVQRREFEDKNTEACSFYLVPVDGQPLPPYRPGQFLTFKLSITDPGSDQTLNVVRCYSLSDAPQPEHYRVTIKRVSPPGLSSTYFHEQVTVGQQLEVKAPSGHFYLSDDKTCPIVLIGGGIGITPMLSMLNSLLAENTQREVWLFYSVRNGREQIMRQHLNALARTHPRFHLHICYSSPDENDVEGMDYRHKGRIDVSLLRSTLKLARYQFYVCGPRPMMESLVPALEDWGVDRHDIFYESFGPASLAKRDTAKKAGNTGSNSISIHFQRSGKTLDWDPGADSLLSFAEAHGIEIASGCRAGSCGTCQTALIKGSVSYNQQADAEVMPGHCLLCITLPETSLVLDA